jgi:hypothetical protein
MLSSKEFTYQDKTFIGVRKLFGEGGYYLEEDGPEKFVKFKDMIFPRVEDVIVHALEVMKTQNQVRL